MLSMKRQLWLHASHEGMKEGFPMAAVGSWVPAKLTVRGQEGRRVGGSPAQNQGAQQAHAEPSHDPPTTQVCQQFALFSDIMLTPESLFSSHFLGKQLLHPLLEYQKSPFDTQKH